MRILKQRSSSGLGDHCRYPAKSTGASLFQITNNIWQGRFAADRLITNLQFVGITHILNVSETPNQLELADGPFRKIQQISMRDGVPIPEDVALNCIKTLHDCLCEDDANLYIHCVAGWNRSPTILWLYMIACGVDSVAARSQICRASIDAVPAHPKLITPHLVNAIIEFGETHFQPHPKKSALEPPNTG